MKTYLLFLYAVILLSINMTYARPPSNWGKADLSIHEPVIDLVGDLPERKEARSFPGHRSNCDDGGCGKSSSSQKASPPPPPPPAPRYICVGLSCPAAVGIVPDKTTSIKRIEKGTIVEQIQITTNDELKDTANKELNTHITEELAKKTAQQAQPTEALNRPHQILPPRLHSNEGIQLETRKIGTFLENAKTVASEKIEKDELDKVTKAASEYSSYQESVDRKIEQKIMELGQEEIGIKEHIIGALKNGQSAPIDLKPLPPSGEGALQELKNISNAIFDLIYGGIKNEKASFSKGDVSGIIMIANEMAQPSLVSNKSSLRTGPISVEGEKIRQEINTHLAIEKIVGTVYSSVNNPSTDVTAAYEKIIGSSAQMRELYTFADRMSALSETRSYQDLMSSLVPSTEFMKGFANSLVKEAAMIGAGAALVAMAPQLVLGGVIIGASYALINYSKTYEMISNVVEDSLEKIMHGSSRERGEIFGSLTAQIGGLIFGGELITAMEKALLPAVSRATTQVAVVASTAKAVAKNLLSEEGAAGMNVLAKEAPEVARTIINSGKEEIAGLLLGGKDAGAEPLLNGYGNVIREKGEQVFEKEIGRAIESAIKAKPVAIPWGSKQAVQEFSQEALKARVSVEQGKTLYRLGTRGVNNTGKEAQFWALESPSSPTYAQRYGIPPENIKKYNFIETAKLKDGTNFVTRASPQVDTNFGGAIEVVVPEDGVDIIGHYSIDKLLE